MKMDDKAKLVLVSGSVVIVLLFVLKMLGYIPTSVAVGKWIEVKLAPGLPPVAPPNGRAPAAEANGPLSKAVDKDVNIDGRWKLQQAAAFGFPSDVLLTQSGDQVKMTISNRNGEQGTCQGVLGGRSIRVDCTYGTTTANYSGTVVAADRIELTTYYGGRSLQVVLWRP
jgi:hypothetical protein